jgi:hypothetical protein
MPAVLVSRLVSQLNRTKPFVVLISQVDSIHSPTDNTFVRHSFVYLFLNLAINVAKQHLQSSFNRSARGFSRLEEDELVTMTDQNHAVEPND